MSLFDHRMQVKNILLGVTATIDDNVTAADIIVLYEGGPENLKYLFYVTDYDVVITVGRPVRRKSAEDRSRQDVPLRYNADVPVHTMSVDKTGITATKVLNKVRDSIETQVETNAQQPTYTLMVDRDRPVNLVIGGYDPLWRDSYVFMYRPLVST